MHKKTNKRRNKGKKTRKQKVINMIGCSKKHKRSKSCKNKKTLGCTNCGPTCHCEPNCKCPHPCPGSCYLNRRNKKQRGGAGCGSCGCPLSPLSWNQMNKFGGGDASYPTALEKPVIISPPKGGYQHIVGIGQNGGSCSACNSIVPLSGGGNFFKPIGPMPGSTVGSPWGANFKLPGMDGIGSNRNYFGPYNINNDPSTKQLTADVDAGYLTKNSMVGGYTYDKKSHSSAKRGGGLIPQDLVNLGRDFNYNLKSAYNAFNGYEAPVNPLPYKGQLTGQLNKGSFT